MGKCRSSKRWEALVLVDSDINEKQGSTECYDCNTKPVPKSFPVCTIRSTPSQPIHCIVWAKSYLFQEIFGTSEDESTDVDQTEDTDNGKDKIY